MARHVKKIQTHDGKLDYGGWKRLRKTTEKRLVIRAQSERKDWDTIRWQRMRQCEISDYANGTAYMAMLAEFDLTKVAKYSETHLYALGVQQYGERELCIFMYWTQSSTDEFHSGVANANAVYGAILFGEVEAIELYREACKRCYGQVEATSRRWLQPVKPTVQPQLRRLDIS